MKLLIMGYARHGKDEAANYLSRAYGLKFTSTSLFCAEHIVLGYFDQRGIFFKDAQECFEKRGEYRDVWYRAISAYNRQDPSRLARLIFEHNDIYCGLRGELEFKAAYEAKLFDKSIWIDRLEHVPAESVESCTVRSSLADRIADNNSTLENLRRNLDRIAGSFGLKKVEAARV